MPWESWIQPPNVSLEVTGDAARFPIEGVVAQGGIF